MFRIHPKLAVPLRCDQASGPLTSNHHCTSRFYGAVGWCSSKVLWVDADVRTCSSFRSLRLVYAECPEWMCSRLLRVFQGKAAHGGTHSAGGSVPHGEEPRRMTSTPVMPTSRGGVGGEEQKGAKNLWCDYSNRVWYLDWACQDASIPTTGRCGPVLFVVGHGDTTRLAGSVVEYADEGSDILKFTLRKLYRSDGSVDKLAKGCMVGGKKFGGYDAGAMALPFFVPLSPGHDEVVHTKDFLKVMRLQLSLAVAWTSTLGHPYVVLLGSREETVLVKTEANPRREAGGNVAGDEDLLGLGATREISSETIQSGGKRILPIVEVREGAAAYKRQRNEGGSARTPMTKERDSVEKRERGKGKPKKGAEEKIYYVQVPEPNIHCWKELADLTDREKRRLLNGVLNLTAVWVQSSSNKLAEQGKHSVTEMVDIIKIDRIMLRLWHYVKFKHEEMKKKEWNVRSSFFRSKQQLFEYADKGLDEKLWNESRKFFNDNTYVNKCPQYLGCQHDSNVKKTVALVNDPYFPAEWKRVVLSVITGDRAQSRKGPWGVDECINILSRRTSVVTMLAPFVVDPLNAMDHKGALGKMGHQLRSHTCVLDLCGTVDRSRWDSGAFASLSEFLGIVCEGYRTLVVFIPYLWNLSFMTFLSTLGATRCYTGKWVRKTPTKKTHQFGNSMWKEPDVMHILFKGDDPQLLTHPVYEGTVSEDDVVALRRKQKVTPMDVEEKPFKSLHFADFGNLTQRGVVYKEFERNPNQLYSQLIFFCGVADVVLFLGNPHAQVVWNLLHQGWHVLALEGDSTQLEYTVQFIHHEVQSGAYACDFHHVVVEPVYDPNKDMFFKLTSKKRRQVYSFLFGHQPNWRVDEQFVMRKEVAIAVL
ncbi:hypothetical protein CBR_g39842 [Chara braunii]|uniref:Uncharacterized protein n=1 Tax=Chara braunii TaxID=69332 RepID=A0A388LSG8_CHABU|nr:hypothetical protein CBR_g39842 [Chara braunii]|eukprot:GBG85274.1 hypothetical protein CBR_g39842 [Chara braunii]